MRKFFNGIRWIIVFFLIIPTFLLLVGNGILTSVGLTVTNPENPKEWLREGNLYENSVQFAIDEAISRTIENPETDSPFEGLVTEEEIRNTANAIFTPEWIQGEVEPVIDSAYALLNRETDTLEFQIDLSTINQNARREITQLIEDKLETAEDCTQERTSGCIPPNIDRNLLMQRVEQRLQGGLLPTQKQSLGPEDLNMQTRSFDRAQEMFSFAKVLPWFVYIGILILTLLLAFLSPRSTNTFKIPGYLWISAGAVVLLMSIAGKLGFSNLVTNTVSNYVPPERTDIIELVQPTVEAAFASFTTNLLLVGLATLLIGSFAIWYVKRE